MVILVKENLTVTEELIQAKNRISVMLVIKVSVVNYFDKDLFDA